MKASAQNCQMNAIKAEVQAVSKNHSSVYESRYLSVAGSSEDERPNNEYHLHLPKTSPGLLV